MAQTRFDAPAGTTDGASFEEVFDQLFRRAFRLARRIVGDSAAAEDIAAEAMARAYADWARVESLPYRDGWVLRVATNLSMDRVRRHPPVLRPEESTDTEEVVTLRLALTAALTALPRRQRQSVALRYLGGLSDGEVALALGISPGSVKTHIHRGLAGMRKRLGPSIEEVVPVGLDG